jgi:hypothetical protein
VGCLFALLAGFLPRFALVCVWIFTNDVDRAYDTFILPLLGLIFLPLTTLVYALFGHRSAASRTSSGSSSGWRS